MTRITPTMESAVRRYAAMALAWWIGAAVVIAATVSATSVMIVRVRHARAVESLQANAPPPGPKSDEYLDPSRTVSQSVPHRRRGLFERIEARSYDQRHMGKDAGDHVGFLSADTWLKYENVDFGPGANWFSASVTVSDQLAGNTIEVRLRDPRGPILAALPVESTGGWGNFTSQVAPMTSIAGVHDIYLTFSGGDSVADLAWFKFTRTPRDATATLPAHSYDATFGARDHRDSVGSLDEGHWLRFGGLDFGPGVSSFTADLAVPQQYAGKIIEVRLERPDGPIIGELRTRATGGWDNPRPQTTSLRPTSGIHDVYLTFRGGQGAGDLFSLRFSR